MSVFLSAAVKRGPTKRGPHFLCVFGIVLTACSVGLALSRGGILFANLWIFLLALFFNIFLNMRTSGVLVSSILAVMLAVGLVMAHQTIDWKAMKGVWRN